MNKDMTKILNDTSVQAAGEWAKIKLDEPIYYTAGGIFFFMVFSESRCIQVCSMNGNEQISNNHSEMPLYLDYESSTKEIFDVKFAEVTEKIKNYTV